MITELDILRFTEGDCHYLARVLSQKTGRPIGSFNGYDSPDLHAFLIVGRNKILDVEGLRTRAEFKKRWRTDWPIKRYSWEDVKVFGEPTYSQYTYVRAQRVADELLEKYQIESIA